MPVGVSTGAHISPVVHQAVIKAVLAQSRCQMPTVTNSVAARDRTSLGAALQLSIHLLVSGFYSGACGQFLQVLILVQSQLATQFVPQNFRHLLLRIQTLLCYSSSRPSLLSSFLYAAFHRCLHLPPPLFSFSFRISQKWRLKYKLQLPSRS